MNDALDLILFGKPKEPPAPAQASMLLDPKARTQEEPWFWGTVGRPLLPERLRPYLEHRVIALAPFAKGAAPDAELPLTHLLDGTAWKLIDYLKGPAIAAAAFDDILGELVSTAVREIPVLDASLVNGEALARLPLMHRTIELATERGVDLAELGALLPELTMGDLIDRFGGDSYSVLDIAMSTRGWLIEHGVGTWLREPTTDQTDLVLYGRFLARQLLLAHRARSVAEKQVTAIATLLGWSGKGPSTLQVAGDAAGMTRERVRQIRIDVVPEFELRRQWPPPSDLTRAVELIKARSRATASDVEADIRRQVPTAHTLGIGSVVALAREAGILGEAALSQGQVFGNVDPEAEQSIEILRCARQTAGKTGFTSVGAIAQCLSDNEIDRSRIRETLAANDRVLPLVDDHYYVGSGSWVVGATQRMLAANPRIALAAIRAGLVKRFAARKVAPPPPMRVLRDFYAQDPRFIIDGDIVSSTEPLAVDSSEVQWQIIEILRDAPGGALHIDELTEVCRRKGIKPGSVGGYCAASELISKPVPGVYTVVGRELPAEAIENVQRRARAAHTPMRCEATFVDNGTMVVTGTLNRKVCNSGSLPLPAKARSVIGVDRFALLDDNGAQYGQVKLGADQTLQGFGQYFFDKKADEGVRLLVTLDLDRLIARASLTDSGPIRPED